MRDHVNSLREVLLMAAFSNLNTAWFALIGLLWAGYFFLEGFDFGTAILTPFIIRDEIDRRLCLNAVGPTWDGNEVWLLVAGGATFAAFPLWYAKLFSGFYLALFLILLALIARGVSFEFRDKRPQASWKKTWDAANFFGSLIPAIVWGVAFTDLVHGLPLGTDGTYRGGLLGLLHPIALLGGFASLCVFLLHGAVFLALKTTGPLSVRAKKAALVLTVPTAVLLGALLGVLAMSNRPEVAGSLSSTLPLLLGVLGVLGVLLTGHLCARDHEGLAFSSNGFAILALSGAVFMRMFPSVLPSSTIASHGLTIEAASSGHLTLVVMTVVAAIFTPFVLAYQTWSYWVFRKRLSRPSVGEQGTDKDPSRTPQGDVLKALSTPD